MSAVATVAETLTAGDARSVAEVMSHGVVTCDGDAVARDVARTMRDRGVDAVFVLDLGSETIGLLDERALLEAWDDPDATTAAELMNLDPLVLDPRENIADAARRMLEARATHAVVAPPPPTEESGAWSAWKERGMPLGTLSVVDILSRVEDWRTVSPGAGAARGASVARRAAPWIALVSVVLVLAFVALLVVVYATGTHHLTNRPGLQ